MYENGERMFGLTVSEYPILHQRKKDFNLLSKLYSLYLLVLKKIDGYAEITWSFVDMTEILAEVADLHTRCRVLPKGMQTWPAYVDLKKKIDDFNEMCPLLELMRSKSMQDRHWEQMEQIMDFQFDIDSPKTTLGKVIQAPLLEFKDQVQVFLIFIFILFTYF